MCARCSEKTADRDVRRTVKRSGAGLKYVPCTIYGQHERRRPRTRPVIFALEQRGFASAPRVTAGRSGSVAAIRNLVAGRTEHSG